MLSGHGYATTSFLWLTHTNKYADLAYDVCHSTPCLKLVAWWLEQHGKHTAFTNPLQSDSSSSLISVQASSEACLSRPCKQICGKQPGQAGVGFVPFQCCTCFWKTKQQQACRCALIPEGCCCHLPCFMPQLLPIQGHRVHRLRSDISYSVERQSYLVERQHAHLVMIV